MFPPRRLLALVTAGVAVAAGAVVMATPAAAADPIASTVITAFSEPGETTGHFVQREFDGTDSTITGRLSTSGISLSASGSSFSSDDLYYFDVTPPDGTQLQTGAYPGAQRAGFADPGHPGLDVAGHTGCNEDASAFDVRDLASTADGTITRLDLVYEQHCEGERPALFGEIRIGEPQTDSVLVSSGSIVWPLAQVGATSTLVPVYIRNTSQQRTDVGAVYAYGANASAYSIPIDQCSNQVLAVGGSCVVWVAFTPRTHGPLPASLRIGLDSGRYTVHLDGTTGVGTSSLQTRSRRGDDIGGGRSHSYDTSNATFSATGTPQAVSAQVASGLEDDWTLAFAAGKGHTLRPGTYKVHAQDSSDTRDNSFAISEGRAQCSGQNYGSFTVHEAAFSRADGSLQHLKIRFTFYCPDEATPLTGTIEYAYEPHTSPPPAVTHLRAQPGGGSISLSWHKPKADSYAHEIVQLYSGTPVAVDVLAGRNVYYGRGSSTTLTGLTAGAPHTVAVYTVDRYGNVSAPKTLTASAG